MKFPPESSCDRIEILKIWFWLAPFFGAGGKIAIKSSWYADQQDLQVLVANDSRRVRDIFGQVDRIALSSLDYLTTTLHFQLTGFHNEDLIFEMMGV